MILITNLLFVIAAIVSRAYKQWNKYYDVMLFVSFCNLLYNFLCHDYIIWSFYPDLLLNHKTADLVNTFLLLPSTTLLYLTFFPAAKRNQVIYYFLWVTGYSALEYLWYAYGRITYHHGWHFVWSIAFYFFMFLAIRLLHSHRAAGLLLSVATITFLIIYFHIPIWKQE
ncbi:hypothetical protein P5G65_29760 [Paenibacillus chondroitinus]|uniref:Uncharacterized protein n=1 Tax=Paenibacillus chondroitinus TaxID=59842 RepID=A0ABU6DK04_9BACL|nr:MULTISPECIES: CBO0543 family protein [Paenibacillus]MCY9661359.1 hypothetical protein [Paenibacillus anseongense]MEB4798100.1 hypothetical protein [Paenibacillus chondroitinus]